MSTAYRVQTDKQRLLARLKDIRQIGDAHRNELGFLRAGAYGDAVHAERVIALEHGLDEAAELAGTLMYSGVWPHAKVQQIAIRSHCRRQGLGTLLLSTLLSTLEQQQYLDVRADVAEDLDTARAFYESNGFVVEGSREGGMTRERRILLYTRSLESPRLFHEPHPPSFSPHDYTHLIGLKLRSQQGAPLYVIDVNVLIDIALHDRERTQLAQKVLKEALAHRIRLAVTQEMGTELKRGAPRASDDPVLRLAQGLPELAPLDDDSVNALAPELERIVFADRARSASQKRRAHSDARHLAASVKAGACGFITSDSGILGARNTLLSRFGLDVTDLEDFESLASETQSATHAQSFWFSSEGESELKVEECSLAEACEWLHAKGCSAQHIELSKKVQDSHAIDCQRVKIHNRQVAVASFRAGQVVGDIPQVFIYSLQDYTEANTVSEYLLYSACKRLIKTGPRRLRLIYVPGQISVSRAARTLGFFREDNQSHFEKVVLGTPVTPANFDRTLRALERNAGVSLTAEGERTVEARFRFRVPPPQQKSLSIPWRIVEDQLGPGLMLIAPTGGVVVPISKSYATQLFEDPLQHSLLSDPPVQLSFRRTFFCTTRARGLFHTHTVILFYETMTDGGRGHVFALARITDRVIVPKKAVPRRLSKRGVVRDFDELGSSEQTLALTFVYPITFPRPVALNQLRDLEVDRPHNLQSPTRVSHATLLAIVESGWG